MSALKIGIEVVKSTVGLELITVASLIRTVGNILRVDDPTPRRNDPAGDFVSLLFGATMLYVQYGMMLSEILKADSNLGYTAIGMLLAPRFFHGLGMGVFKSL